MWKILLDSFRGFFTTSENLYQVEIRFAENVQMSDSSNSHRQSFINLNISLDQNNVPENIQWEASDAEKGQHEAKAMLLGLWDKQQANGISIDLWTKEMTVPEMNIFFYQSFLSMSDTIFRATKDPSLREMIRNFAASFMEKVNSAK